MNDSCLMEIQSAICEMGLPIRPADIEEASRNVCKALCDLGVDEFETADRLTELWATWLITGVANAELKTAISALFSNCSSVDFLGTTLFELHDALVEKDYLTHEQAMAVIGSAERIVTLAQMEKMCSVMISEHLGIEGITFHSIQRVLRLVNAVPEFTLDDAMRVMELDKAEVPLTFKDDNDRQALQTLAEQLSKLNCPESIVKTIDYLESDVDHEPYMFMIHFELLPLEKYDRYPGKGVYEFSPRGQACNYLWSSEYNENTQNPYLNNAKGFAALDMTWAENRKGKQGAKNGPVRLVELFEDLCKLPYPSRRHAGRLIRRWLCRRLSRRLDSRPDPIQMPKEKQRANFFSKVMQGNTSTLGIIDQRACDLLAVLDQPEGMRPKARGLGSSVNETNLSAAKLGDVEFVDYLNHTITGYEAHGGQLRDEYIDLHVNTMERILTTKRAELREEANPNDWSITVKYVAHDVSRLLKYKKPTIIQVGDYSVRIEAISYESLILNLGGVEVVAKSEDLFETLVHERLNFGAVPSQVSNIYYQYITI